MMEGVAEAGSDSPLLAGPVPPQRSFSPYTGPPYR